MYKGKWEVNVSYNKGDIVYSFTNDYYVCYRDHVSDNLMYPSTDDIFWVKLDADFLDKYTNNVSLYKQVPAIILPNINEDQPQNPVMTKIEESPLELATEQEIEQNKDRIVLKRKLRSIERNIEDYKRRKVDDERVSTLREKLLLLNVDIGTKTFILDKYDNSKKVSGGDQSKTMNWLKCVSSLPYGKYKSMKVSASDRPDKIKEFFKSIKEKLDRSIYGLEDVKQEILEFVARKITNPHSKGHVLALCGKAGVGKTKIIKSLAKALDLPFFQINCGGLNDASVLIGHSETYIGSKPGKIVEILQNSNYMNPIIYLDEIDKISEQKATEINGILTHLLDEEQNDKFQDNYLSNVNINLSKVFFVIAFNDINNVDEIVSDRMKVINIGAPSLEEKVKICQDKMVPEIIKTINFSMEKVIRIDRETLEYIILNKSEKESGVRQLKKNMEKILNRLNYDILVENLELVTQTKDGDNTVYMITHRYINNILKTELEDQPFLSMYL